MSDEEEPECECEAGAPAWMATFSDMATLMLCFFVLLLSFANMDVQSFRTALGSVRDAFGVQHKVQGRFESLSDSPISLSNKQSTNVLHKERPVNIKAVALVREFLRRRGLASQVEVSNTSRGLVIRTKDQVLFAPGEAKLREGPIAILDAIRELSEAFEGQLSVEGHTDDKPVRSPLFPSNWELSGARSAAVLRYLLTRKIDPASVHVAGYADMRPVADNGSPEGRSRNRRVEFVFEHNPESHLSPAEAFRLPEYKKLAAQKRAEAEAARKRAAELQQSLGEAANKARETEKEATRAEKKFRRLNRKRKLGD